MAVDPSIALSVKPLELQNPLDIAAKGMTLSNLGMQNQEREISLQREKQAQENEMAIQTAYKNNTVHRPDGVIEVNHNGVLSELANSGKGYLAQGEALKFQKAQLDKMSMEHGLAKSVLFEPIENQADLDAKILQAKKLGLKPLESQVGTVFDADPASQFQQALRKTRIGYLTAEEQLAQQNKQIDQAHKERELNIREGEYSNKRAERGDKQDLAMQDKIDKYSKDLKKDLDADATRAGNFGKISEKVQSSERLETLVKAFSDGNLPPAQTEELALGMVSMLAPGGGQSREQVKAVVPHSALGDASKFKNWLFNEPGGANQQKFVQMMADTIAREKETALNQLNNIRASRLPAHARLKSLAPDQYDSLIRSYGIDPSRVDNMGRYKPESGGERKSGMPIMNFNEWDSAQQNSTKVGEK